jgi:FkbM family methyltransferase
LELPKLRIWVIRGLIDINEKLFFNRKIINFYKNKGIQTIIDVGSNKGQSIDLYLKINPKCVIYAFEPNPILFDYLLNKYEHLKNVTIFNVGISDNNGEKIFYQNVLDYTSSFEKVNVESNYLSKKSDILSVNKNSIISDSYPVKTITLSEFIENTVLDNIVDLIKIDTEGHEYYCLLGLFSKKLNTEIRYIQFEFQNNDMYLNKVGLDKIESLMSSNKFRFLAKIKHGFGNFDELIYSYPPNEA